MVSMSAAQAVEQAIRHAVDGDAELSIAWTRLATELREGSTMRPAGDRALTLHDVEGIVCAHGRVAVRRSGGPGTWFLHTSDRTNCDDPRADTDWQRRITANEVDPVPLASGGVVLGPGLVGLMPGENLVDREGREFIVSPAEATVPADNRPAGRDTDHLAQTQTFLRPDLADKLAETAVIEREWQPGDRALCRHDDLQIYVYADVVDNSSPGKPVYGLKQWRHEATDQVVCPAPPARDASGDESYVTGIGHTFAEPR